MSQVTSEFSIKVVGYNQLLDILSALKWLGPGYRITISVEAMSAGTVDSIIYVAADCKDKNGDRIEAHHNHRHPTPATILAVNGTQITVDSSASVEGWFKSQDHPYRRGLAFYNDINGLPLGVVHNLATGAYSNINGNIITLCAPLPASVAQSIVPGQTKLMNHFSTGTYHYGAALHATVPREWTKYTTTYDGEAFNDAPGKLRMGTAEVSLVVLANFEQDQNSVLLLRNPTLKIFKSATINPKYVQ